MVSWPPDFTFVTVVWGRLSAGPLFAEKTRLTPNRHPWFKGTAFPTAFKLLR